MVRFVEIEIFACLLAFLSLVGGVLWSWVRTDGLCSFWEDGAGRGLGQSRGLTSATW